jgi:bifunctional non-homologous end joining protein LigD
MSERRAALERVFAPLPPMGALDLSPVIATEPEEAFALVCGAGGEGVIAKRRDAPYQGGRSGDWLKIKCRHRAEFVIVGWQASNSRARPFASLVLAAHAGEELTYAGKVGTGFDQDAMAELAERMAPLVRKEPPVKAPRAETRGVTWIGPELVAEIDYAETTVQNRLRHAVFLGLRDDKPAHQVQREEPVNMSATTARQPIAGIAVSSGDRMIFPDAKVTKADLARYYRDIAPLMLPQVVDRPLSLLRLPEGLEGPRFFQKHPGKGFPDTLKTLDITESDGERHPYAYGSDATGLVAAVQMGTVEFHIWGARRDRLDRPDRLVFDLDPDEGLEFARTRRAALDLRDRLEELGLQAWAMLSGGKGVHLVVPLRRSASWDTAKLFAKGVATLAAQSEPDRFTADLSKARRKGRIFIDWLRNERGATSVAPFSVRARPGAPVACPVTWDELSRLSSAAPFGLADACQRGWADVVPPDPQGLTQQVVKALDAALRRVT